MIGIRGAGEIGLVARVAGRRRIHIAVIGVTLNAGQGRVHARQRVVRIQRVVEIDGSPVARVVARIARCRETSGSVPGIIRPGPVCLMAAEACRRECRVVVVGVTLHARKCCVNASEREYRSVVERRRGPVCCRMTQGAIGRKS